jgi:hypothetical protein
MRNVGLPLKASPRALPWPMKTMRLILSLEGSSPSAPKNSVLLSAANILTFSFPFASLVSSAVFLKINNIRYPTLIIYISYLRRFVIILIKSTCYDYNYIFADCGVPPEARARSIFCLAFGLARRFPSSSVSSVLSSPPSTE